MKLQNLGREPVGGDRAEQGYVLEFSAAQVECGGGTRLLPPQSWGARGALIFPWLWLT